MRVGLGTYAFFWRSGMSMPGNGGSMPLGEMIGESAKLGAELFQVCDYPGLGRLGQDGLAELAETARRASVELEVGTRGSDYAHLERQLEICSRVGARMLRTMTNDGDAPASTTAQANTLRELMPLCDELGVTIGLETYERVPCSDLVEVVRRVDHPRLGICLDPANSVAALELPSAVIDACAPFVVQLHVKDFRFERREGLVGFSLVGCPLGEGLLDLKTILNRVIAAGRDPTAIVELWVPFRDSHAATRATESRWAALSLARLRDEIRLRRPPAGKGANL